MGEFLDLIGLLAHFSLSLLSVSVFCPTARGKKYFLPADILCIGRQWDCDSFRESVRLGRTADDGAASIVYRGAGQIMALRLRDSASLSPPLDFDKLCSGSDLSLGP